MAGPFSTVKFSRRRFVKGLAIGGGLMGLGFGPHARSGNADSRPATVSLSGNHFDLSIGETPVSFTGMPATATTINGSLPGPTLRWRQGEEVTLAVTNHLAVATSIHWHGILLPAAMDGVPGISFPGIAPGETFTYRFRVRQAGTYWYHSHSGFQEQTGMYGAIVIDPAEEPIPYDRDYVVMLSDWSDEAPETIYANLKKLSHYYNVSERTASDLWREIQAKGVARTWQDRLMWNRMRMSDRDLSDVTGYTYTFLMNGQTPDQGWTGLFNHGERVRLRFINGAAMTFFDVRIPGLRMRVIAADGQDVEPVTVEEFRLGVAETLDVLVEPSHQPYTLFAQAIDRSGYALGTLTPDPAQRAPVPAMDPLPVLGHADMGMGHTAHGAGPPQQHTPSAERQGAGAAHGPHSMPGAVGGEHGTGAMAAMGTQRRGDSPGHAQHGTAMAPHSMPPPAAAQMHHHSGPAPRQWPELYNRSVRHAATEYGPHVDMLAEAPRNPFDDPGVGLRENGRRVLTYGDLVNRYPTSDTRVPEREVELHLTGNMGRYMWSINGVKFADAEPLRLRQDERLRIIFVNDTMMNHPMHLHGMWSELESGDPGHLPRKHTVVVQPGSRLSYLVTADALGDWAFHCHLLYHMPGMFRRVSVSQEGGR